jgi:hypothetical protein
MIRETMFTYKNIIRDNYKHNNINDWIVWFQSSQGDEEKWPKWLQSPQKLEAGGNWGFEVVRLAETEEKEFWHFFGGLYIGKNLIFKSFSTWTYIV